MKMLKIIELIYVKKCLCEKLNMTSKEYKEMMIDFIDQGCELF